MSLVNKIKNYIKKLIVLINSNKQKINVQMSIGPIFGIIDNAKNPKSAWLCHEQLYSIYGRALMGNPTYNFKYNPKLKFNPSVIEEFKLSLAYSDSLEEKKKKQCKNFTFRK